MRKTYKRETAWVLLAFLMALAGYAMWPDDPALVEARAAVIGMLALPILSFAAFAYGAQWISSQTNWGGDPAALETPPANYPGGQ